MMRKQWRLGNMLLRITQLGTVLSITIEQQHSKGQRNFMTSRGKQHFRVLIIIDIFKIKIGEKH